MQITSRKEIGENKSAIFEEIKMFSRCAIYLHKGFYLGHLLVSNFFSPHSRSCCKHFSGKVKSVCANMTGILMMGREGGGKASSSSLRMTQLLFFLYIQFVSISKSDEVPAELSGQPSFCTERRGTQIIAIKNTSKAWGNKCSWKRFQVIFNVRIVAENISNSTQYVNWPCKKCNCALYDAPNP